MRVTCERNQLTAALGVVNRAVANRNTIQILNNVLIEAEGEMLKLTATDLDTSISNVIVAKADESGALAVPGRVLGDVVSRMPDAPVTLELQDGKVKVQCGKSSYVILSLPAEDFPATRQVSEGEELEFPQCDLKEALRLTAFAASREENRSILMGVLFEAKETEFVLVATDTHRLALKKLNLQKPVTKPLSAVIPARPLGEIERLLKDSAEETVKIAIGSGQVQVSVNSVTLVSRLLDGQFPNYEKVLPSNTERKVRFSRAEMLDALKRLEIVAFHSAEKIRIATQTDALELTAESAEVGSGREYVPISMDGEDITIAFNARYVMEVLDHLTSDNAVLELTGPLNPGLIKSAEGTTVRDDFSYVVMPMQI